MMNSGFDRTGLEELLKHRFFYAPAFSIYGGVKGLYDYGPPGIAVKNSLIQFWRQHFVIEENLLEIESTSITPDIVFQTSGHVDKFMDLMVRDTITGDCFRADHLLEKVIEDRIDSGHLSELEIAEMLSIKAQLNSYSCTELDFILSKYNVTFPESGNPISPSFSFNLMFPTQIGPSGKEKGYLRPETAQGIFVNFKRLLEFNGGKLPFGAAQVGLAFRNEISPRSGLLRLREFTLAEIEYFTLGSDSKSKRHEKFHTVQNVLMNFFPRDSQMAADRKILQITIGEAVSGGIVSSEIQGYFLARTQLFLLKVGIRFEKLRFRQHLKDEMAHYACDCWDAEIETSYGWIECVGNADRSAYDLSVHSKRSGESLSAFMEFEDGPRTIEVIELVPDKSIIGRTFKSEGKQILSQIDCINEKSPEKVQELKSSMESNGSVRICGKTLTPQMLKFKNATRKAIGRQIIPNVIEPSFGIGRILYCIFEHAYYVRPEDPQKSVLSLKPIIAPIKVSIFPLMKKDVLTKFINVIANLFTERGISHKIDDSSATIGKRYARTDEIGIPFAVTIDYSTPVDQTVTLRERDSTRQVRVPLNNLADIIFKLVYDITHWTEIERTHPPAAPPNQ